MKLRIAFEVANNDTTVSTLGTLNFDMEGNVYVPLQANIGFVRERFSSLFQRPMAVYVDDDDADDIVVPADDEPAARYPRVIVEPI